MMRTLRGLVHTTPSLQETMKQKSDALVEAEMRKSQGELGKAADLYAEAARLEYQIAEFLRREGLERDSLTNLISCAWCYYDAAQGAPSHWSSARKAIHEALELCGQDEELKSRCLAVLAAIGAAAAWDEDAQAAVGISGPGESEERPQLGRAAQSGFIEEVRYVEYLKHYGRMETKVLGLTAQDDAIFARVLTPR